MLDINKAVKARIVTDSIMISLMDINALDHRIYYRYPDFNVDYSEMFVVLPDPEIYYKNVAIIYRSAMSQRPAIRSYPQQIQPLTYFFKVLSTDQLKCEQVSERLKTLFDETTLTTDDYSVKKIKLMFMADGGTETGSPNLTVITKNVNFKFSDVFERN